MKSKNNFPTRQRATSKNTSKKLAAEVTLMVHNQNELDNAEKASKVLLARTFRRN